MAVLVGPGAAVSQEAPPVPVISPTSGPPGTVISVTVPGCTGFVGVAIGDPEGEPLAITGGPGPTVQITVPTSAPQGEILVVAGCDVYDENDLNATTFTITAGAVAASPTLTG